MSVVNTHPRLIDVRDNVFTFQGGLALGRLWAQPHLYTGFVPCGQSFLCLSDLSTKSNEFSLASSVYNKGNVVLGRLCLVPKNRRHKI